jgi:hypothetical protein
MVECYDWKVLKRHSLRKILICHDKTNIKRYIDKKLPEEYEKCLVGLNSILREAWNTSANTEDKREKIQALFLAKECYSMKLDLLTLKPASCSDRCAIVSSFT